jgi:DNA invertase Pin-like site-specific DNA recombinase
MKQSSTTLGVKNAVIFTRVSSERQEEGHSLNAQLKRLQEYCHKQSLEIIKEYQISESSTLGDRKQFNGMIKFIESENKRTKTCIALVVDSVDRLQRGFKESALIDELRRNKVIEIHFYKEGFCLNDSSSSSDIMRWDFGILGAKMYVASLSDNVKRGNKYAWEKGLWTGKPPIGYKKALLDNGKHTFVIDESKAYYVKEIFNLYAHSSYSLKKLERKCKEWGLISNKTISNEPITKNTIDKILRNPFYYGEMYIKKYDKYYKHNYKPIIERWLFEKCKSVMHGKSEQGKKQKIQSSNNGEEKHIFSGLLTCAITGKMVSPVIRKGRHNNGIMYHHLDTWDPKEPTRKIAVREEDILEQVKEVFKSISITNEKLLNEMTEYLQASNKTEAEFHKAQMEELNKRALENDKEMTNLIKKSIKGSITEDKYEEIRKELEKEQFELNILKEKSCKRLIKVLKPI